MSDPDKTPIFDKPIMIIQNLLRLERSLWNKKYNNAAVTIFLFIVTWGFGRFMFGLSVANDPDHCRMKSIGDFLIAPMYTIGCNIGKDRWDIKVN